MAEKVTIHRAPVLTLWGAAVAEWLGFEHGAALTMGKCLAKLNAQSQGRIAAGQVADPPRREPRRAQK